MCWPRLASSTTSERTSATLAAQRRQLGAADDGAVRDSATTKRAACGSTSSNVRGSRWPTLRFAGDRGGEWRSRPPRSPCGSVTFMSLAASTADGDRRFEQRQTPSSISPVGDHVRRQQPDHGVGRAVDQQLPLAARLRRPAAAGRSSSSPHISPAPRTVPDRPAVAPPSPEARAPGARPLRRRAPSARSRQLLEEHQRGAAGQQVAAVGAAVIAGRRRRRDAVGEHRRADRHAGPERLADRHQIRLQAERAGVERPARPPEAALHFVGDEQRAGARGSAAAIASAIACDIGRTPPSPWIGSTMTAAVSLVTAAAIAAGSSAGSTNVTLGDRAARTARGSGRPRSPTARPSSGRGTSARTRRTVARGVALRVPEAARELQARLDRLRAAVAEERARQARQRGQPRRDLRLQRMEEQVRRVQQRRRLLRDRARRASDCA